MLVLAVLTFTLPKPVVETSKAKASADKPKVVRKSFGPPLIEDWISDSKDEAMSKPKIEKKTVKPSFSKIEFGKFKEQVKSPSKTTVKQGDQNRLNTHSPRGNQRNWNHMMSQRLRTNFVMINKACNVCGSFDHLQYDCDNHQRHPKRNMVPKAVLNAVKGNQVNAVKASACWVWRPKQKEILNHVSKHNRQSTARFDMLPLEVTSKEGKSQAELTDESHVLFKVPRKNNMYSVDLKNIVPKGGLTCLFAKATSDESVLWHRRLGHKFQNYE
ncbi:hypothetical protein Tco_1464132 [Tanacetum coccineum]